MPGGRGDGPRLLLRQAGWGLPLRRWHLSWARLWAAAVGEAARHAACSGQQHLAASLCHSTKLQQHHQVQPSLLLLLLLPLPPLLRRELSQLLQHQTLALQNQSPSSQLQNLGLMHLALT
jgi:hypothetical protein